MMMFLCGLGGGGFSNEISGPKKKTKTSKGDKYWGQNVTKEEKFRFLNVFLKQMLTGDKKIK